MARTYASPLRDEQSAGTRLRIVEAVARVLARGVTELAVPAVAAEAGVSVATVYRHFKNKPQLVEGLARHYADQVGTSAMWRGELSLEQLEEGIRGAFTLAPSGSIRLCARRWRASSPTNSAESIGLSGSG